VRPWAAPAGLLLAPLARRRPARAPRARRARLGPRRALAAAVTGAGDQHPACQSLYLEITEYLQRIGGRCRMDSLRKLYKSASDDFLHTHFDVASGAKQHQAVVSLRTSRKEQLDRTEAVARRVARQLFRLGGSADLHDITRRFGISKKQLLAHAEGKVFDIADGQLRLSGGSSRVAAAAVAAGAETPRPGRRSSRRQLLTSKGVATDDSAARRLQLRIEGLLLSAGDGVLPVSTVYDVLALQPTPALRRWFRRSGLRLTSNGELRVASRRLAHHRVRRGASVAALLARAGGRVPRRAVLEHMQRPPALVALEAEAQAAELAAPHARRPRGGRDVEAPVLAASSAPGAVAALARADEPLAWAEAWLRDHFWLEAGAVELPPAEAPRPAPSLAAGVPRPAVAEERALLMQVAEELRLRYGRAHCTVLAGCFEGVRRRWLQRFFDVTPYGDVVPKSVHRQTREVIAISRRMVDQQGVYTVDEAFCEFGATEQWLHAHFAVDEAGVLAFDDDVKRFWDPPPEERAPSPWSYAKLDAPRGYIRKGNGKYLPMKYGHSAGGLLY